MPHLPGKADIVLYSEELPMDLMGHFQIGFSQHFFALMSGHRLVGMNSSVSPAEWCLHYANEILRLLTRR
jgi:hypothetical protein